MGQKVPWKNGMLAYVIAERSMFCLPVTSRDHLSDSLHSACVYLIEKQAILRAWWWSHPCAQESAFTRQRELDSSCCSRKSPQSSWPGPVSNLDLALRRWSALCAQGLRHLPPPARDGLLHLLPEIGKKGKIRERGNCALVIVLWSRQFLRPPNAFKTSVFEASNLVSTKTLLLITTTAVKENTVWSLNGPFGRGRFLQWQGCPKTAH